MSCMVQCIVRGLSLKSYEVCCGLEGLDGLDRRGVRLEGGLEALQLGELIGRRLRWRSRGLAELVLDQGEVEHREVVDDLHEAWPLLCPY